jgi:hypothetical protein
MTTVALLRKPSFTRIPGAAGVVTTHPEMTTELVEAAPPRYSRDPALSVALDAEMLMTNCDVGEPKRKQPAPAVAAMRR